MLLASNLSCKLKNTVTLGLNYHRCSCVQSSPVCTSAPNKMANKYKSGLANILTINRFAFYKSLFILKCLRPKLKEWVKFRFHETVICQVFCRSFGLLCVFLNPITRGRGGGWINPPVFTACVDPLGIHFDPRYFFTSSFYVLRRL